MEFGQTYTRIPLAKSPHIRHGDALEIDWGEVLPLAECSYVLGNPPFVGQSYQSPTQRRQMAAVINSPSGKAGSLDYVRVEHLLGLYEKMLVPLTAKPKRRRRRSQSLP